MDIKYAWIPGTVRAVQDSTGQGHPISIGGYGAGEGLNPFELMRIVQYSSVAGTPKGQYALPPHGSPWQSQDKKLIVYSGNVTGWCHFRDTGQRYYYGRDGRLDVVDAELEKTWVPDPPDPDDPHCYQLEDDAPPVCDSDTPSVIGSVRSVIGPPFGDANTRTKLVCDVTDWFELRNGLWVFTDTVVDGCWLEWA